MNNPTPLEIMKQARDLATEERNLAKEPREIKHWEAVFDTLNMVVKIIASTPDTLDAIEGVQDYAEKAIKTFTKHLGTMETDDLLILFVTAETYLQVIKTLMDLEQAKDTKLKPQNDGEQL